MKNYKIRINGKVFNVQLESVEEIEQPKVKEEKKIEEKPVETKDENVKEVLSPLQGNVINVLTKKGDGDKVSIAEGFVTASLLFCVGAMTIIGSLESGLKGDHTTIFTKSILDLFSSCMLSASLGIGVIFAAIFVFIFQGGLVLMAGLLEPLLSDGAVAEITCVGSLMILALGFNLTGIAKFKVANYFPALVFAPLVAYLFEILGRYIPALA